MDILSEVLDKMQANPKTTIAIGAIATLCVFSMMYPGSEAEVAPGMSKHEKEMRQLNNQLSDMQERRALQEGWEASD